MLRLTYAIVQWPKTKKQPETHTNPTSHTQTHPHTHAQTKEKKPTTTKHGPCCKCTYMVFVTNDINVAVIVALTKPMHCNC